jgi:hypothetical protein
MFFIAPENAQQLTMIRFSPQEAGEGSVYPSLDDLNLRDITLSKCDSVNPDSDCDFDVDFDDLAHFQSYATGSAIDPPASGCESADLDHDGDVDQDDFGIFERCFSGTERVEDLNCAK